MTLTPREIKRRPKKLAATEEEQQALRRQYESGMTTTQLAIQEGRSRSWIATQLINAGTVIRPRGRPRKDS